MSTTTTTTTREFLGAPFEKESWLRYVLPCFIWEGFPTRVEANEDEDGNVGKQHKIFRHNPCVFLSMYLLWLHCLFLFR